MSPGTYDKPSEVVAEDGRVLVDGPDSVDVALSPEAAHVTGGRLIEAAAKAAEQARGKSLQPNASGDDEGEGGDQPGGEA
jgi:hypothetical protein